MVETMSVIFSLAVGLIATRWLAELMLARMNRRHVLRHAHRRPDAFAEIMDDATYARSVEYTLAKNRWHQVDITWEAFSLIAILASGLLPWSYVFATETLGTSPWARAAYLFGVGFVLSLLQLPLEWHAQFRLEARFGFNTTTVRTWVADHLKGLALALLLGYPLLVAIVAIMDQAHTWWWLLAWAVITGFQLLMVGLAPAVILPWFNKLTPLPEGSLKERLLALAERTSFRSSGIQVMDGSRRSRHSNAFFAGLGRWRKIVLFDTLIEQLTEPELEAVLAHEIAHFRRRHIRKMVIFSAIGLLGGLFVTSLLIGYDAFPAAFGFAAGETTPALLLVGILLGTVTFWLTPFINAWSRRFEYEADRFAAIAMKEEASLIGALRKLTEKNLGNLTPHPVFSTFYYSHPTLLERESALRRWNTAEQFVAQSSSAA
jgi:STE24 endopeptidase